jgi:dolichol-phosphate mannosyltransferase
MTHRTLTVLPVYNEVRHLVPVLDQAVRYSQAVLVVDDGSTDGTSDLLAVRSDIHHLRHPQNQGYGAALRSGFAYAIRQGYDTLVTIDCDGQHEPQRIPEFVNACHGVDIVSGSRYLRRFAGDTAAPAQRRHINRIITAEVNWQLGLSLTDAFCGFKAYRVKSLREIEITETGYAMPLELWVQAAALDLRIVELPVPLIYLDETRSFGGALDNGDTRLEVYREVLRRATEAVKRRVSCRLSGSTAYCGD